jgi:transposase, IS5 family
VSQPRDDRQNDLFGPSLEKIINLRHPPVRLAAEIDWAFLAGRFSSSSAKNVALRLGRAEAPR